MYCSNCGFQVEDDAQFCSECGAKLKSTTYPKPTINNHYLDDITSKEEQKKEKTVYIMKDSDDKTKTSYADTSFKCAMFALLCWCCCGFQLAGGGLAAVFGILAIRNKEPDSVKAYIGLVLGIAEFLFFIIIIIAGLNSEV